MIIYDDIPIHYNLFDDYRLFGKATNMAKADYVVQGGYYHETLEAAVKDASRRAARGTEDLKVYKAVKLVAPKSPEVDITDIV